jgi:ParB family chromosome partitioning protein
MYAIPLDAVVIRDDRVAGGLGNIGALAKSIEKVGLINPIRVRGITAKETDTPTCLSGGVFSKGAQLISGRRRLEAVRSLGWHEIPAIFVDNDEDEKLDDEIVLAENVNRSEMNPVDEGKLYAKLMGYGSGAKELAEYFDRPVSWIYQRASLAKLVPAASDLVAEGKMSVVTGAKISQLSEEIQETVAKKVEKIERSVP